jgi:hypothetical protein
MQYSDSDIQAMKLPLDGQKYRMNSDRRLTGNEERDEEACEKAGKLGLYWQNLTKDVGGFRYYPQMLDQQFGEHSGYARIGLGSMLLFFRVDRL